MLVFGSGIKGMLEPHSLSTGCGGVRRVTYTTACSYPFFSSNIPYTDPKSNLGIPFKDAEREFNSSKLALWACITR